MIDLEKANQALDRVKLRVKGNKLYLRATLPPKPGDGRKSKRYELSTGIPYNAKGIEYALAKAKELEADLILERFSWYKYLKEGATLASIEDWVRRFEINYWQTHDRTINREDNYRSDWTRPFTFLPPDEPLTEEVLRRVLLRFASDSRDRRRCYVAFNALANFAELEANLKDLRGNYKPKIQREIFTDGQIESIRNSIKNPAWQWVFGICACYGLRPHEVFRLNCERLTDSPPILSVEQDTKTGLRSVFPLPGEWVEKWQLWAVKMPNVRVEGRSNTALGSRVSQEFYELNLGLTPYHLRTAYAVRACRLRIPDSVASQWMGHDITVHYRSYQRHIDEIGHQIIWESLGKIGGGNKD